MTTYICPTCGIGAVNAIHSESGKEPNEFTVARAAPDLLEALEMILDLEPDKMHDAFNIASATLEKVRNDPPF